MRYVVYEVWTKSRIIEAESEQDAYDKAEPEPRTAEAGELNLSNWHVVPVDEPPKPRLVGGLNFRQVEDSDGGEEAK